MSKRKNKGRSKNSNNRRVDGDKSTQTRSWMARWWMSWREPLKIAVLATIAILFLILCINPWSRAETEGKQVETERVTEPSLTEPLLTLVKPILDYNSDYLIITSDNLYASAMLLKEYRESYGHNVSVVPLSCIKPGASTNAENVDDWIEEYHIYNQNLEFIVLLGDASLIPTASLFLADGVTNFTSDLAYAIQGDVTPHNYLRDLKLGRIPVKENEEFENYFEKIVQFEQTVSSRKTIIFFGWANEMKKTLNRDSTLATSLGYNTIILVTPTAEELYESLNNNDVVMAVFYGHGTRYTNSPLTTANLNKWQNKGYPIIYLSGGCDFGDNSVSDLPLSSVLLLQHGGAVATLGASKHGGYGYEYQFIPGFFNTLATAETIGEMYNISLEWTDEATRINSQNAIISELFAYYFSQRMKIEGDPALRI